MKTPYQTLVRDNPMRIEIARFRRRFLGFGGTAQSSAVLALILLCYTGIVVLVVGMHGDLPPMALIVLQTILFCVFGPMMLHGSIAGERERRSWDLLIVAPITKAQIVAGKFLGSLAALGVATLAIALPMAIAGVAEDKTSAMKLFTAEGVSIAFGMMVCAWTILVSARSGRPFMALGVSLGSLAIGLVALPMLFASIVRNDQTAIELFFYSNPFAALASLMSPHGLFGGNERIPSQLYGVPHILAYLVATVALLKASAKTLSRPDRETASA